MEKYQFAVYIRYILQIIFQSRKGQFFEITDRTQIIFKFFALIVRGGMASLSRRVSNPLNYDI